MSTIKQTYLSPSDSSIRLDSLVTVRSADPDVSYTNKQRQSKTLQTYRGVESRSNNSNVRKQHTHRRNESSSHRQNRQTLADDFESLSNASFPRPKKAFVTNLKSPRISRMHRDEQVDSESCMNSTSSRGNNLFVKDSKSFLSDTSMNSSKIHAVGPRVSSNWRRVVSTSRSEYGDKNKNAPAFDALKECAHCARDTVKLKLLPCLHSFCIDCLDGQIEQAASIGWVKCLLCSRRYEVPKGGVGEFDNNAYIDLNEQSISENDRCITCAVEVPKCRCSDCNLLFCTECVKDHLRTELDKSHYIVNVVTEMVGKAPQTSLCDEHESFALSLYCVNCEKLVCGRCAIGKHNNHIVDDIHIAATDRRNDLRDLISIGDVNRITREIADYMHNTKKEKTRMETNVDRTITSVQTHVSKLKEELEQFEKDMIHSIKEKKRSIIVHLETKIKDAELQLRSTHLTLQTMRIVNERARDIELIEKYPNLKSLACDICNAGKSPSTQCVRLSYTALVHSLKSSIGRVNIDSSLSKSFRLQEVCSFQLFKHITSIYAIDSNKAWVSFRKYMQVCCKDGSYGVRLDLGEPVCCLAGNSNKTVFIGCKTSMKVLGSKMSPKFLFHLPHEPSDMKFTDMDNIIIVFKDARRVTMLSTKGKPLQEFDLRHLGYRLGMRVSEPWKLAINKENGDIFISDFVSEIIAVFDKNYDIKTAITTNVYHHATIAFDKGLLFLTDYKRDCLHIYSTDGHLLQTCRVVGINSPCSIAVDGVSDIWIGAWGGMVKVYAQR